MEFLQENLIYLVLVFALIGIGVMIVKAAWIRKQDAGDDRMKGIAKNIQEGALAFLKAEYRILLIFVLIASIALFAVSTVVETTHWIIVVAFIFGAFFSALAGNRSEEHTSELQSRENLVCRL